MRNRLIKIITDNKSDTPENIADAIISKGAIRDNRMYSPIITLNEDRDYESIECPYCLAELRYRFKYCPYCGCHLR